MTWQLVESTDKSYYTVIEGLWTWAEVAAGILVSCVPVLPRFLQHVRSEVGNNFKFGSISSKFATGSKDITDKSRNIFNSSAHLAKHRGGRDASSENSAESARQSKYLTEGRYLELDDYDKMVADDKSTKDATKRHDLEHASSGV